MELPAGQIESSQIGTAQIAANQGQRAGAQLRAFAQRRAARIKRLPEANTDA
jgi:hypothetical protein